MGFYHHHTYTGTYIIHESTKCKVWKYKKRYKETNKTDTDTIARQ